MNLPLDILLIICLIVGILAGYPVSFTLSGVAALFALIGWLCGVFDPGLLGALSQRIFGLLINDVLTAIPLFVFMGIVLEKSRIAEELLETMGRLFGKMRGGLGISVVFVGALLAASTGIVGATVVAMGLIALPTMLRNNYSPDLACGIVCTSGTLGQIIPPSTLLIILADVMSNAYQQAQYEQGVFTIETISVGQMFTAAIVPGLLLVFIYLIYLLLRAWLTPKAMPSLATDEGNFPAIKEIGSAVLPPIFLIIAVLGSILGGVATPSEAASVGAIGAILMAGARIRKSPAMMILGAISLFLLAIVAGIYPVRLQRTDLDFFDWLLGGFCICLAITSCYTVLWSLKQMMGDKLLKTIADSTMVVTAMIFATMLTASIFSLVFIGLGGQERIEWIISAMPGGANGALIFCMIIIFILGFFLDFVEISVILLPLVVPILITMGHDPIWLAVLIAINLQTSFLTPPFGFSLFYLRGATPEGITTAHIYRGVMPFILLQTIGFAVLWFFPTIATWLPNLVFQ